MACGDPIGSHRVRTRLVAAMFVALAACSDDSPSVLDPRGPGARRIEGLWWLMFWISAVVFLVVVVLLIAALVRRRRPGTAGGHVAWGEPLIVVAGVIVPALVLAAVFVVSLRDLNALSTRGDDARLTIEVIGHNWWWEARYPDAGVVTANEIHIPVGEPVRLRLTSADVIHSFWVPQLQVKTDQIPGKFNQMWIQADEPGRYRGQCAEFCGLQHANMIFYVVAQPPDQFSAWLANEARPADDPTESGALAGQEVFLNTTCAGCHAIRGTEATSTIGPDLTHLASRETIASGVLDNTRADLELWITNPQDVKPGATMPPTELTPEELEALLDYLEQLD